MPRNSATGERHRERSGLLAGPLRAFGSGTDLRTRCLDRSRDRPQDALSEPFPGPESGPFPGAVVVKNQDRFVVAPAPCGCHRQDSVGDSQRPIGSRSVRSPRSRHGCAAAVGGRSAASSGLPVSAWPLPWQGRPGHGSLSVAFGPGVTWRLFRVFCIQSWLSLFLRTHTSIPAEHCLLSHASPKGSIRLPGDECQPGSLHTLSVAAISGFFIVLLRRQCQSRWAFRGCENSLMESVIDVSALTEHVRSIRQPGTTTARLPGDQAITAWLSSNLPECG